MTANYFRAFIGAVSLKQRNLNDAILFILDFRAFIGAVSLKRQISSPHARSISISAPSSARSH